MLSRKLSAKPQLSVLCPMRRPSLNTTVFTAPIAAASGASSVRNGTTLCLKGWVTLRPEKPSSSAAAMTAPSAASSRPSWSKSTSR